MALSFHVNPLIPGGKEKPSNCYGPGTWLTSSAPSKLVKGAETKEANVAILPGPIAKPTVLVIGAGISGLRAASVLQRHGLNVTVLEARDRIGGRIFTSRKEGAAARDIGAAWMHETSQNKLVKLIKECQIEYYYDDGTPLFYTEHGKSGSQFKAKKVADEFADYIENFYDTNPEAPDRSVLDFIVDFTQNHDLITEDERAWAPQAVREVELWIGTSIEQASSKLLSYFVTERNLYMKGGYDRIVNWTANSLVKNPNTIRLGHEVEHVKWSGNEDHNISVSSKDSSGKVHHFEADAIVVSVPLGVLHHDMIQFEPALPSDIQEGLDRFSYGALGKVFFEFSDVFWSKDNDQLIYYPPPGTEHVDPAKATSILSYATVTINTYVVSSGAAKELCVQIAEPLTQRIEAMTDKAAIYAFFEPLFKLFRTEPYKALPRLVNVESTHWTQDRFAGFGSYSADKCGDDPDLLIDALDRHRGSRLQFAGEHTTAVGNGCVHGAFKTGETAAVNLLKTLGMTYDGGDMVSLH